MLLQVCREKVCAPDIVPNNTLMDQAAGFFFLEQSQAKSFPVDLSRSIPSVYIFMR